MILSKKSNHHTADIMTCICIVTCETGTCHNVLYILTHMFIIRTNMNLDRCLYDRRWYGHVAITVHVFRRVCIYRCIFLTNSMSIPYTNKWCQFTTRDKTDVILNFRKTYKLSRTYTISCGLHIYTFLQCSYNIPHYTGKEANTLNYTTNLWLRRIASLL